MHNLPLSFYTSWLLFLPVLPASLHAMSDVVFACVMCACLSILHHGHGCVIQAYGDPDRFAARAVSLLYVLHVLIAFPMSVLTIALYGVALVMFMFYMRIRDTYKDCHKCHDDHWVVHVLVVTCLLIYVKLRSEYCPNS